MTLIVTVHVPSGIVMGGDSRTTGTRREERREDEGTVIVERRVVLSDYSYKVIALRKRPIGIATFDAAIIENQHVDTHVTRFEEEVLTESDSVSSVAHKLVEHFARNFVGVPVGFHVCGYEVENGVSMPYVYSCHTVTEMTPKRWNIDEKGRVTYGILWCGEQSVVNRLITKDSLPPFGAMPLQDAIDYAIYVIRTTIDTLRFEPRFPTVGGAIDVLLITPDRGPYFIQRKELRGG